MSFYFCFRFALGVTMKTLEKIEQLEQVGFGRPRPRHGLKLLYWFVHDCLTLDQNNVLQLTCYPKNGDFGFHIFENRYEINGDKLLPDVNFTYYVVGNLSYLKASKLPWYVREDYTGSQDNSNMDRIIVSSDAKWFHAVYVTQHKDRSRFNKHATYLISKRLIVILRGLTLEQFLLKTGYLKAQTNLFSTICVNTATYEYNAGSFQNIPTIASSIPAITPSINQDTSIEMESPPITIHSQANYPAQDNTRKMIGIPNLQPTSQDNQKTFNWTTIDTSLTCVSTRQLLHQDNRTASTCHPASRNQDTDTESSPVSLDDTQTYLSRIFGMARRCNCTIL